MDAALNAPGLISVVVPVYNAQGTLSQQLRALDAQDYDGPWEAIVVDNGSQDASRRIADAWIGRRGAGRLVDAPSPRGPGVARNAGARVAGGDFLAFCDADDVAAPGWLAALAAAAGADLVAGRHEAERLNGPATVAGNDVPRADRPFLGFLPMASGSNLGVWTSVFQALGGFDERSRTGEDVAFSWKAQLAGYQLAVAPGALMHLRFPDRMISVAARYYRYGQGDAWLFSQFASLGMQRRTGSEMAGLWRELRRGLPTLSGSPARRCRWIQMVALSCGRLAGSIRHGVVFP